jgi:hypothetical protein
MMLIAISTIFNRGPEGSCGHLLPHYKHFHQEEWRKKQERGYIGCKLKLEEAKFLVECLRQ